MRKLIATFLPVIWFSAPISAGELRFPDGLSFLAQRDRGGIFRTIFRGRLAELEESDLKDAFLEFSDPGAATARIEATRVANGIRTGTLFVRFENDNHEGAVGTLRIACGVSRSSSKSIEAVQKEDIETGWIEHGGTYENLRYTSRSERVRAIARCLATMDQMPPLKTARTPIKTFEIDELAYEAAETYLRAHAPTDASAQPAAEDSARYRKAFQCLLIHAAADMQHAVGDRLVLRAHDETSHGASWGSKPFRTYLLSISSEAALRRLRRRDLEELYGLWPVRLAIRQERFIVDGFNGPIEQLLQGALKFIPECQQYAGL